MTLPEMIAVSILSGMLTSAFVYGLRTKGPWRSTWSFLLVLVVALSAYSIWAPPAGPVWYGAAWIDLLVTGLFVSIILSAVTPSSTSTDNLPVQQLPEIDQTNNERNRISTKVEG
ncbi:MAG: hypothetical protein WKF87_17370 [Chryseolinea sp.]